jgi:hypothetical protein
MSIESRLQALEKRAAQTLPVYLVTFEDGSRRRLDALELLLHLAALEAGRKDTADIKSALYISGTLPAGIAWDSLRKKLEEIQRKGKSNEKARL